MSIFENVQKAPQDPILGLTAAFHKDERKDKINLTAGVYKNEDLITPILACVKEAESRILLVEKNKEYLPIDGDQKFLHEVGKAVFSEPFWRGCSKRVSSFQTIGGTGAIRIAAECVYKEIGQVIHIPDPSWPNHRGIFSQVGFTVKSYPYYDAEKNTLCFDAMKKYLLGLEEKSVILLHACCHNPSGMDPSLQEWNEILQICKEKKLIPFFDAAYLGFHRSFEEDAKVILMFLEEKIESFVAISFSKNFSLYGERVGALYVFSDTEDAAQKVTSQIKILIRRNYSNPHIHGAKIVASVLSDPQLKKLWQEELSSMRMRIYRLKEEFSSKLCQSVRSKDYSFLAKTNGMFCFCGLDKTMAERLMQEFAIYMTYDGRINVAGLTEKNMDYVASCIAAVLGDL